MSSPARYTHAAHAANRAERGLMDKVDEAVNRVERPHRYGQDKTDQWVTTWLIRLRLHKSRF